TMAIALPPGNVAATTLRWEESDGSVEFSYAAFVAPFMATRAKLVWATGPSITDELTNAPIIFNQPIPAGFQGPSPPVSLPESYFQTPPANATHILLVVDPDNLLIADSKPDNVLSIFCVRNPIPDITVLEDANSTDFLLSQVFFNLPVTPHSQSYQVAYLLKA